MRTAIVLLFLAAVTSAAHAQPPMYTGPPATGFQSSVQSHWAPPGYAAPSCPPAWHSGQVWVQPPPATQTICTTTYQPRYEAVPVWTRTYVPQTVCTSSPYYGGWGGTRCWTEYVGVDRMTWAPRVVYTPVTSCQTWSTWPQAPWYP